jgi:hypothetical protein
VKLKLKIPTKLTPRQTEIIKEFDSAATASSGATGSAAEDCKQTFNIQEAWKRLKTFLGTPDEPAKKEDANKAKADGTAK